MTSHIYDAAETILCGGLDLARSLHDSTQRELLDEAEVVAIELLLSAVERPADAELRHTADVAEMILDGQHRAAAAMHVSYGTAELEREDLGVSKANLLDLSLAGLLLEADAWRLVVGLELA